MKISKVKMSFSALRVQMLAYCIKELIVFLRTSFFFFNQETGFHWRKEPDNFSSSKNHNSSSERLIKRWYPNQAKILFQM